MYISLGPACSVKYQIDNFLKKNYIGQKTQFFDYLMTSEKAILIVFDCKDVDTILKNDCYLHNEFLKKEGIHSNGKSRMVFKKIDNAISIHVNHE